MFVIIREGYEGIPVVHLGFMETANGPVGRTLLLAANAAAARHILSLVIDGEAFVSDHPASDDEITVLVPLRFAEAVKLYSLVPGPEHPDGTEA